MNPGYEIGHRYRIIRSLGEGGMANVYLAHDMVLDRDVSVKLLRLDLRDDPSTKRRFHREAMAATQLNDPHIVGIYDVGEDHGLQYMVMQYVKGTDLKAYIKKHYPIPLPQVIDIMEQVLSAVATAHAHGIIHRDLKPQNILIDENKNVKITDFGIAVAVSQDSLTQTNTLMGSVHYLSPEQARGSIATKQSDIYSLGIILFELLTGKVPFEGETAVSIALKHFREEIPSVREQNKGIPQALENVIIKATAKEPAERYNSVNEMAADLKTVLDPQRANEPRLKIQQDDNGETKVLDIKHLKADDYQSKKSTDSPTVDPSTKTQKWKKYGIVSGTLGMIVLIAVCSWWFLIRQVIIPDVEGMTVQKAEQRLHQQNLRIGKITQVNSQAVDKNRIVSTNPDVSHKTRVSTPINLTVSTGVKQLQMADYVGEDYSSVAANLRRKGFQVHQEPVYSDDIDKGQIIKQNHKKGTIVKPASDTIIFRVSAGKEPIKIPNFKNQDISAVQQFANKNNLQLTTQEKKSKTIATNHVINQTPRAGSTLNHGDTLTVSIANSGNQTKTTNIQINIPFDGNGGQRENRVQVYIRDANHNLTMEYQDITINQETTINVPFTLKQGQTGAYRVVRNGRTIMSATNITG
ncbi:serine/threonine protein kinase [Limosilactobacillus reuteri]|jgi:Serine/threonine protein kinase|uniref:non-specific serine/threonine protein kinase n=1 Tax=Limosilactobacillus reuteri TaxID=1598 RepID=A0A256V4U3_LIMRT|nr:Stk1 family PASTA domain-containing Ser/Thr kinase [Limosilactobacillus reuteri]MCR1862793.1 Stk1 family PASTA domain-containing Ser/Thr kinase [Limosilactobacillus reuteri]MCR1892415.1 Stk1 family PASTA domain-containing Ser/Thr kinase [Limosilactobacillus reuteri]MRH30942.1 Stk1 family PASTA domain-containing Ser/Thr kinase [Limosilactobacillus reuteri]OYS46092.1 serine/threonine protein kinase [Limosilactobacillus reuteri]OYS46695.1 serine/threonine protein kinase [Limosilactobacillus re